MNKSKFLIGLIGLFLFLLHPACRQDEGPDFDKTGVRTKITPTWTRSLHKEGSFYSNSTISDHLLYKGNPIIATTEGEGDGERYINLVDIDTGEDIWKWNDIFLGFGGYIDISYAYIHDDLMWYQKGSRSYTINLEDGSTQRKERFSDSFDRELSGLDQMIFLMGPSVDTLEEFDVQVGYVGNLQNGQIEQFLIPKISQDYIAAGNQLGGLSNLSPFVMNSDTFLPTVHSETLPDWHIDSYLGLYNFSKKEWVYERLSLVSPTQSSGLSHLPIIYGDTRSGNYRCKIRRREIRSKKK
ncbi:MAG: hypothetical protein AAF696_07880 [Bacteroidota bacterium]